MLNIFNGFGGIIAACLVVYVAQYAAQRQPWFTIGTRRLSVGTAILSFTVGLTLASGAVAMWLYPKYETVIGIQHHGTPAIADVIGDYRESCRGECLHGVVYRYVVIEKNGRTLEVIDNGIIPEKYRKIVADYKKAPIVYDRSRPNASLINFDNAVLRRAPSDYIKLQEFIGFVAAVAGGFVASALASVSLKATGAEDKLRRV